MAEFSPITSQEQLDSIIGERLQRERAKYADYDSLKAQSTELKDSVTSLTKQLADQKAESDKQTAELNAKIARYERDSAKTKAAIETGLPVQMIDRLRGETEDEIKSDAKALLELMNASRPAQPLRNPETGTDSDPLTELSRNLMGKL